VEFEVVGCVEEGGEGQKGRGVGEDFYKEYHAIGKLFMENYYTPM
jgi:hypothetical protein